MADLPDQSLTPTTPTQSEDVPQFYATTLPRDRAISAKHVISCDCALHLRLLSYQRGWSSVPPSWHPRPSGSSVACTAGGKPPCAAATRQHCLPRPSAPPFFTNERAIALTTSFIQMYVLDGNARPTTILRRSNRRANERQQTNERRQTKTEQNTTKTKQREQTSKRTQQQGRTKANKSPKTEGPKTDSNSNPQHKQTNKQPANNQNEQEQNKGNQNTSKRTQTTKGTTANKQTTKGKAATRLSPQKNQPCEPLHT